MLVLTEPGYSSRYEEENMSESKIEVFAIQNKSGDIVATGEWEQIAKTYCLLYRIHGDEISVNGLGKLSALWEFGKEVGVEVKGSYANGFEVVVRDAVS